MKLRAGHVSNSSSSSFIVYGAEISEDDMILIAERLGMSQAIVAELKNLGGNYRLRHRFNEVLREMPGCGDIEVSDLDDELVLGVAKDIDNFDDSDLINGIVSKETVAVIDRLCELVGESAHSFSVEICC
ncbi:hypothetical protein [Vibrio harveyi]|uniref:hypothetical protein n=1 Tax=Vibrio harveyi TaxID=669 RepID=UPI003CEA7BA3